MNTLNYIGIGQSLSWLRTDRGTSLNVGVSPASRNSNLVNCADNWSEATVDLQDSIQAGTTVGIRASLVSGQSQRLENLLTVHVALKNIFMLQNLKTILHRAFPGRRVTQIRTTGPDPNRPSLRAFGINDFLNINIPAREMLLSPILPERSLAMLYAPRGVGKSWLGLSIGLAVAAGESLLRWSAPRQRNVLYVDGEMPLVSLQERLKDISTGFGRDIPNDGFRILAADNVEGGINLSTDEGQQAPDPLLEGIDLVILDNLSTLCPSRSESASDARVPMQNWLLSLRRQGISVLLIHHAGTNGRQRGTFRREDALDTVIALRRPEDYSPEQGARFEIHFEKLRNRVDAVGAMPFEARLDTFDVDGRQSIRWSCSDLKPPMLMRAAELFGEGMTVREVAATLRIAKVRQAGCGFEH